MSTPRNRRDFHKTVLALAGGSLASAGPAAANEDPGQEAVAALMTILRARHGKHLGADQLKRLREKVQDGLAMGDSLQSIRLKNSDEPAFVWCEG